MGWSSSWVGVQGGDKAAVLASLGLVETGREVEPGSGRAEWSVSEIGGWLIVFSEDFDWGTPDRARELSAFGPAVSLQFEDEVEMASIASAAADGAQLWRVSHVNEPGQELTVTGDPPAAFASIRDEHMANQAGEDGDSVDFLHDIPIELAKAVCGYCAHEWEPPFTALSREGEPAEAERRSGPGLFGVLKGLFGGR